LGRTRSSEERHDDSATVIDAADRVHC
jgi:hypothetical protein